MGESAPPVWLRGARVLAGTVLDWVFPRHCYDCGEPIHEPGRNVLCPVCTDVLLERRIDRHFCAVCGLPLPGHSDGDSLCLTCMAEERYFDRARSFFPYDSPIAPVVRAYKFRGDFYLGPRLLKGILRSAGAPPGIEIPSAVVAVPLHPRRLRERGYNQSALLGRVLARWLDRPLLPGVLRRTRHTSRQTGLSRTARRDNVRGAFRVARPGAVDGLNLLLVDDVMTTGATVDECCKVLKRAGAAEVQVITLARTVK